MGGHGASSLPYVLPVCESKSMSVCVYESTPDTHAAYVGGEHGASSLPYVLPVCECISMSVCECKLMSVCECKSMSVCVYGSTPDTHAVACVGGFRCIFTCGDLQPDCLNV